MKKLYFQFLTCTISSVLLAACGDNEPAIAGSMSISSVCNTSGYIIRKNIGKNVKTASEKCTVTNIGGNSVEIQSGYITPLGSQLRYTARGYVSGSSLILEKIKVHGIDNDFVPFSEF